MNKFRLPTQKEFENLSRCFSRWNEITELREFLVDDGKILTFAPKGYLDNDGINFAPYQNLFGLWWSSTPYSWFDCSHMGCYANNLGCDYKSIKSSVRLVSDEYFENSIKCSGIYWKPEDEEGYYSYNEAIEKFNKK